MRHRHGTYENLHFIRLTPAVQTPSMICVECWKSVSKLSRAQARSQRRFVATAAAADNGGGSGSGGNLPGQRRRVVITGMGVTSSLGHDPATFYDNLLAGKSGVSVIERFPTDGYSTQIAGEIKDFETGDLVDKKAARRLDLVIKYLIVAGKKVRHARKIGQRLCRDLWWVQ